jgi:apolipoprotein N-acyltransferase
MKHTSDRTVFDDLKVKRQYIDAMCEAFRKGSDGVTLVIHSSYMRTIENGFSLVRPSQHGFTVAADYNGKILNQMYFTDQGDGIMYAELPMQGVNTLYTEIGDVLGWICVIGLLGLIPLGIVLRIKLKSEGH